MTRVLALCVMPVVLLVSACVQAPGTPPERGLVYGDLFGVAITTDPVATSVASASYYLRSPGALTARPALAAQVVAQYEFAALELEGLRFVGVNPLSQILMRQGRAELRAILGVRPDAPPEAVIRSLVAAAGALARQDRAAAEAAIAPTVFVKPPAEVLVLLDDMPAAVQAGRAAAFAEAQLNRPDGSHRRFHF
ncbi:hypothetical protein [Elioraea thermophila]|uniref:hypothetical protein n=1 Tax=Elioraea thermophila TaxID=2185104 RepID=UPI001300319E|nr:hypothetical protein [Elioraea thermophila]